MEKQISEKRKQILSVEELLKNSKLSDENYDSTIEPFFMKRDNDDYVMNYKDLPELPESLNSSDSIENVSDKGPSKEPAASNVEDWWNEYNEECASNLQHCQESALEPVSTQQDPEPEQEPVAANEELDEDLSEDSGSGTLVETVVIPDQSANDSEEDDDSGDEGDGDGFNPFNITAENSDSEDDDDGL